MHPQHSLPPAKPQGGVVHIKPIAPLLTPPNANPSIRMKLSILNPFPFLWVNERAWVARRGEEGRSRCLSQGYPSRIFHGKNRC